MRKSKKMDKSSVFEDKKVTRRSFLRGIGALGLGVAASPMMGKLASAAVPKGPLKLTYWDSENPQMTPWRKKRLAMYLEKHKNITVDFQSFPFTDVGKKVSVGFATGTAPDGFTTIDFFIPSFTSRGLIAPLDVQQLGYSSLKAFSDDHPAAFVAGAMKDGKLYAYPQWWYGFLNYINTKQFKEVGLDPVRDQPQTWEQLGEVAKKLTIKQGDKFIRQGFKFAMHAAAWTVIQFNPILIQCGGAWFDKNGKCSINSEAGVRAMTIRASIIRQYAAEDPADTVATHPLPMMDWLRERCSMFYSHPIPPAAIRSQNPIMEAEGYYMPVQSPGVDPNKRYASCYGVISVISATASRDKQEVLHDLLRFMYSDVIDAWGATKPFLPARKSGWADHPDVKNFPHLQELIKSRDNGVLLPRSVVYAEMTDIMHRAVQKVVLTNANIKATLDTAAEEIDRATEDFYKK